MYITFVVLLLICHVVKMYFVFLPQKSEAKLEEILKEIKSLKDLVSSQEKRIIKLEEQMSKIAI